MAAVAIFLTRSVGFEVAYSVGFEVEYIEVGNRFGRRPSITVAWGTAPGSQETWQFWPKAIFTGHGDFREYGLRPKAFVITQNPGALPQATVKRGLQPQKTSKITLRVRSRKHRLRLESLDQKHAVNEKFGQRDVQPVIVETNLEQRGIVGFRRQEFYLRNFLTFWQPDFDLRFRNRDRLFVGDASAGTRLAVFAARRFFAVVIHEMDGQAVAFCWTAC